MTGKANEWKARRSTPEHVREMVIPAEARARIALSGTASIAPKSPSLNFRVVHALELIEREYGLPVLNLDLISRRLGITKHHLCRIFRREVGIGIPDYVARIRTQQAEKLLKETILTIKEITSAVGYTYVTQLDRAFKAAFGCSPKEYRSRISRRSSSNLRTIS